MQPLAHIFAVALLACLLVGCGTENETKPASQGGGSQTAPDSFGFYLDAASGGAETATGRGGDDGGSHTGGGDAPRGDGSCPKPCDDGLPCTDDVCKNGHCIVEPQQGFCIIEGACIAAGPAAGKPCGLCDPAKSIFALQPASSGTCDDGNACTVDDKCIEGACKGEVGANCCTKDADCPAASTCQTGVCDIDTGTCSNKAKPGCCTTGICCDIGTSTPKQSGTPCGDSSSQPQWACEGAKVKQRKMVPGCDGANGACSNDPAYATWSAWQITTPGPRGLVCALANDTNKEPSCADGTGTCTSDAACNDGKGCTIDSCTAGTCTHQKAPKGTVCGASKAQSQYRCNPSSKWSIQVRYAARVCDGDATCPAADGKTWGAWLHLKSCGADICKDDADPKTQPTCVTAPQCSAGSTCCTATGTWAAKGTKCADASTKVEHRCVGTVGGKIEKRLGYAGCSGNSAFCSASFKDQISWAAWVPVKSCPADHKCEVSYNKTSAKCSDAKQCAIGTTCCDSKGFYAASGTKCSTSPYKTEHKCEKPGIKGSSILKRVGYKGCTGQSTWCSSSSDNLHWTAWQKDSNCAATEACKDSAWGGKPTCTSKTECQPGATCCTKDGLYAAKATKCGAEVVKSETRCTKDGSHQIEHRQAYAGCAGSSTTCYKYVSSALAWTPWKVKWSCPTGAKCSDTFGAAKCEGIKTACKPGSSCCEPTGAWSPKATKCGSFAYKSEYKCDSTAKGGHVLRRSGYGGCTGSGASCSSSASNLAWSDWQTYKSCAKHEVCSATTLSGSCKDVSKCAPSASCCTEAGEFEKLGTKCSNYPFETKYKCSSAEKGADILVQESFSGCTGNSGYTCSTKPEHQHVSAWKTWKTCSSSQYCKVTQWSKSCSSTP